MAAGRLVQDDLCLMVRRDDDWYFDGGTVCFPTLWRMRDRLGQPTMTLHERVPHYDTLSDKVDRFFDRLQPGKVVWRRNWSIKPYPYLHLATSKTGLPLGEHAVAPDGSPYWLRTERQTLRRLPESGAIVFVIKVQVARAGRAASAPRRRACPRHHVPQLGRADAPFQVRRQRPARLVRRLARLDQRWERRARMTASTPVPATDLGRSSATTSVQRSGSSAAVAASIDT